MDNTINITINASAITPNVMPNETEIIFQRHCNYDKENGILLKESINDQIKIINHFLKEMDTWNEKDLKNTYFLFTASNTTSKPNLKRCIETTQIGMNMIRKWLEQHHLSQNQIMNLNEKSNYQNKIHESKQLIEPKMFTDSTGYLEFLREKHHGINLDFWIDFEEDTEKEKREQLQGEGPDQIVKRAMDYIKILQRYSNLFHQKYPNSRLIIWCGTHYDLISPFVKQKVLNLEKQDTVNVTNCGGITIQIDETGNKTVNLNGISYPLMIEENLQRHRHF